MFIGGLIGGKGGIYIAFIFAVILNFGSYWFSDKIVLKISRASQAVPMDANPSTVHLFIVNPLTGKSLMNLFSAHPPMEDGIARLRSMKPY